MRKLLAAAILVASLTAPTYAQNQAAAANPNGPQMQLEPAGLATLTTTSGMKVPMGFTSANAAGVVYSDFNHTIYVVVKGSQIVDSYHVSGGKL